MRGKKTGEGCHGCQMRDRARITVGLAAEHGEKKKTAMIDATDLKPHRTATSTGVKKGRGRLVGLTKGGMNIKLHAISDSQGGL